MRQLFCVLTAFAVSLSLPLAAYAQTPADVTNPTPDVGDPVGRPDIPTRLSNVVLPDVQFQFDAILDPMRVSLTETVNESYFSDPRLTDAARSIILNHMAALQQVELAIEFLQSNRESILSGQNTQFNSVFGNPGTPRDVAVTAPVPLSGLANVSISATTGLVQLDFPDQSTPNTPAQVNVNDFVYVGDATLATPTGFVAQIKQIIHDDDGANQMLLAEATFGTPMNATTMNNVPVYRVVRFEKQGDPARYDRVLMTYQAIRDSLSGFTPGLAANLRTTGQIITYQRDFADINTIWMPGQADFTPLDGLVQNELNSVSGLSFNSTRGADRLVRQAGFSNSDSHFHLDRLKDQADGQTVDYLGRQTLPLLWTEDNEVPLQFLNNTQVPGTTDEDRAFFNNQQTIFGEPDNPFMQYLGRAFFQETLFHTADFFDTSIAIDPNTLSLALDRARRPQRGPLFDLDGDGNAGNGILLLNALTNNGALALAALNGDLEVRNVPETGTPTTAQTDQRRWQMIISSFAEYSTDFTLQNNAVFGLGNMFGSFVPDNFKAQDAGNYGLFANMIGGSSLGAIDPSRIEPFGKRGGAGFFPVVPRQ
ncbi:hypothetical protein GC176_17195 [bacterium]|nr:hypothetical protein [bacterium]